MSSRHLRRVRIAFAAAALGPALAWAWRRWLVEAVERAPDAVAAWSRADDLARAIGLFGAVVVVQQLVVHGLMGIVARRRLGRALPQVLPGVVSSAILAAGLAFSLGPLGVPPSRAFGLMALLALPVALLARELLADLLAGVRLSLELGLHPGVVLELPDGRVAELVSLGLGSSRLALPGGVAVTVRNALLDDRAVIVHGAAGDGLPDEATLSFHPSVDPARLRRLLVGAIWNTPGVLEASPPEVTLAELGSGTATYRLLWRCASIEARPATRAAVLHRVAQHLTRAGIPWDGSPCDVVDAAAALAEHPLFAALDGAERATLAAGSTIEHAEAGGDLCRQGDQGSSLFVVLEGLVDVLVSNGPAQHRVAVFDARACAGEFSLLTGSPRSATLRARTPVRYLALGREALRPVLESRPALADSLAAVMAERQATTAAVIASVTLSESSGLVHALAARIRGFFGIQR